MMAHSTPTADTVQTDPAAPAAPTTPVFSEGPPVPLMVEGLLDASALKQLFSDLSASAQVLDVREKGGPVQYAETETIPLDAAGERLLSQISRAVQVRYRYSGYEWTDTVMALPAGYRVVRCRHDAE
ncbi:MAG: hypothetical protein U0798_05000 [Gemmataceae bacterium]